MDEDACRLFERPPEEVIDCEQKPETDEEKKAREAGIWPIIDEHGIGDCDPSKLEIRLRDHGPPMVLPFRLSMIGPDYTIGFFGKRREGKSFAMRWMLYHLRHSIPRIVVFTSTRINGFWQKFVPSDKIFDGYSPGVMAQIRESQEQIVTYMNDHPEEADKINPYIVIVLEDCLNQDLHHMEQLKDVRS